MDADPNKNPNLVNLYVLVDIEWLDRIKGNCCTITDIQSTKCHSYYHYSYFFVINAMSYFPWTVYDSVHRLRRARTDRFLSVCIKEHCSTRLEVFD